MTTEKSSEKKVFEVKYKVDGGEKASIPESDKALYPKGVDPGVADEDVTSRGDWTPYSKRQRKVAAILIRKFQNEQGLSLQEATVAAFKEVGDPENLDLSEFHKLKKTVPDLVKHPEIKH
jgi:hypothetical protein